MELDNQFIGQLKVITSASAIEHWLRATCTRVNDSRTPLSQNNVIVFPYSNAVRAATALEIIQTLCRLRRAALRVE
jgi:hypothetical protein